MIRELIRENQVPIAMIFVGDDGDLVECGNNGDGMN